MSAFGSRKDVATHFNHAQASWLAALDGFSTYPQRLRLLAAAAETQRKAAQFAELCETPWKPRENVTKMNLGPDLAPDTRPGSDGIWARFDEALDQLSSSFAGDGFSGVAAAYEALGAAATQVADALEAAEQPAEIPSEKRRTA